MHSRIFVVRMYKDENDLPSLDNLNCVTEDELAEFLVPVRADYINILHGEEFNDSVKWLLDSESDLFSLEKSDKGCCVTLNVDKAKQLLSSCYLQFKKLASELTENQFIQSFSMELYKLKELIDDDFGFRFIDIDYHGWNYFSFYNFLREYCFLSKSSFVKFRIEDAFDYHF